MVGAGVKLFNSLLQNNVHGSSFESRQPFIETMKSFIFVSFLAACFTLAGCATCKKTAPATGNTSNQYIELIHLTAKVDGSERFIFTRRNVRYEHKFWSGPTDVTFNGEPWTNLEDAPPGWRDLGGELDLSRAWIVKREGRDVIALEHTARGFDLYLCDSPNGAATYDVTIAVPRRIEPSASQAQ